MKWIKSPFCIRRANRVHALLHLREERTVARMFWPVWLPVFVSFSVVDSLATEFIYLPWFFGFRLTLGLSAYYLYYFARGRLKHNTRAWIIPSFFAIGVQIVMERFDLYFSPYYAGLALVIFGGVTYFPRRWNWAAMICTVTFLPALAGFAFKLVSDFSSAVIGIAMTVGTIITAALFSHRVRDFLIESVSAESRLRHDLRNREHEVRDKAEELVRRKQFERQFSPQVVAEVLKDIHRYEKLSPQRICVLVCDIKNSSSKSKALHPEAYSEVVEEIFDIISAGCLKWDITIDKFTGDGAQAFAGSPRSQANDLERAVKAAEEILSILTSRRDYLESRWQGALEVKFAVCEGMALVGFLGGGAMRSFTAIGQTVSLAHRLCAEAKENAIVTFSFERELLSAEIFSARNYHLSSRKFNKLRGFEDREFEALELKPRALSNYSVKVFGRCPECSTPLVLEETPTGLPKASCPLCSRQEDAEISGKSKTPSSFS